MPRRRSAAVGAVLLALLLVVLVLCAAPVRGEGDDSGTSSRGGGGGFTASSRVFSALDGMVRPTILSVAALLTGRARAQLDRWSEWFDRKFGKFTKDPRHQEGMKGAALMTVMIFFMFLPQWYFKWAVPKEMRGVKFDPKRHRKVTTPGVNGGKPKTRVVSVPLAETEAEKAERAARLRRKYAEKEQKEGAKGKKDDGKKKDEGKGGKDKGGKEREAKAKAKRALDKQE